MYQDLLEMERKLDWTMTRKRVEVQDALARTPTVISFSHSGLDVSLFTRSLVSDNTNIADIFKPYSFFPIVAGWGGTACSEF